MNRGNSYERQVGRMLSRGRVRGINEMLQRSIDIADKVIKDFGGAPANAMTGADAYNPTPSGPPRRKKASRLSIPHE